ncbi:hypothetical protein ACFLZ1_04970, partial [Patescibacteria group bacterium]
MELKNIFSKLNTAKDEKREMFLALEISSEIIKSAVWTIEDGKTTVLKVGSVEEWNSDEENTLVTAVDKSVSNVFDGLEVEPNKIIFGLPENWVEGSDIIEEKKKILGTLCKKLEFKPIGFVVTLEALTTYLKEKEGTPVSSIFIHLTETQIIVSLVKLGKIIGSKKVGRSEDLAADVREGLARFEKLDELPSRMILYNGVADFEEAKQQLMSFDWLESLPFLHFPKVKTLEVATPVKAVAIAGGAEAAKSLGFEIKEEEGEEEIDTASVDEEDKVDSMEKTGEKKEFSKEDEDKKEKDNDQDKEKNVKEETDSFTLQAKAADLGFVQDQDIVEFSESEKEDTLKKDSDNKEIDIKDYRKEIDDNKDKDKD